MEINYTAEETISRFHASNAFVRGLRGPIGSGKSVGCAAEVMKNAVQQKIFKGIRKSRWGIIRECYDDKTEILTEKSGWKFFKDLDVKIDKVATLQKEELVYEYPDGVSISDYKGEMIGFEGEGIDFLVTPDHEMWVSKVETRKKVAGKFHMEHAEDVYACGSKYPAYRVKRDVKWDNGKSEYTEKFFEWLGFWYAEGIAAKYDGRHVCVITQTSKDGIKYTRKLFKLVDIPCSEIKRSDGGINFRVKINKDTISFVKLLIKVGEAGTKFLPFWIKNSPSGHLLSFIEGFKQGDGHIRKEGTILLYTSSRVLADDLQEIALKSGQVANINCRDRRGDKVNINGSIGIVNYKEYGITILSSKKYRPFLHYQKQHPNQYKGWYKKQYDGKVYCAEMKIPTVYVRRNKKAFWCNRTYPELKSTTIKTWLEWFGDFTHIVYSSPIMGYVNLLLPDKSVVDLELVFLALDHPRDIKKLKSLELTGVWVNEAVEVAFPIISMATGRINRFPAKRDGGSNWSGLIADTNSCDIDNWWYKISEEEKPENWEFFDQPAALLKTPDGYIPNPLAENVDNLSGGYDYYLNQLPGKPKEWVKVYILNQYGSSDPGNLVYGDYSTLNHTDKVFNPDLKHIIWTHDFNFTPMSSAILQRDEKDDIYIVDEIVLQSAVARQSAMEFCERYKDYTDCIVIIYGDASGHIGEKHGHESDYIEIQSILKRAGFTVKMKVPRANPAIKDGQNSLRARIIDAVGKISLFVNQKKCRYADKGLSALQLKKGSTFQEEDSEYQHITTALRYFTNVEFPIKSKGGVTTTGW